jgi:phage shock protein E
MNRLAVFALFAVAIVIFVRRSRRISPGPAAEALKCGALLIDVRSREEFNSAHLPNAINLPVNEIEALAPDHLKDKNQPLLLHCHSGIRSETAKNLLEKMGYTSVSNLGSYQRAAKIVNGKQAS